MVVLYMFNCYLVWALSPVTMYLTSPISKALIIVTSNVERPGRRERGQGWGGSIFLRVEDGNYIVKLIMV
jgi:hypothetical protein